ncbi:CPBP family intramembrane glutamic endopeptidase [Actinospica sp.]|uniref:CPBP family intramembrane glutamic endopeptidase n=1 Tax=Actinospica sp. TaxID=1872142 RepID=UPI002B76A2A1|nr:CPBP family intramembrane glutamic endopeptidase [Actinospica sp.]HWG24921.1 CPBP family intramembrane glutamic endopeptidase [Actinospica sp.]
MEIRDQISNGRPEPAAERRIPLIRAFGEILGVYVPSFGLGILSALILLHNPSLGSDQISGPVSALDEILQYVMQASVTVFGVAFFCLQRGVTLRMLFGKLVEPPPYPQPAYGMPYPQPPQNLLPPQHPAPPQQQPSQHQQPTQNGNGASVPANGYFWPGYAYYMPPRPPTQRGRGWQFSRAYFVSMAGVVGFLLSVVIYTAVTHYQTGAPSQGSSLYLIPVGFVVALAAGFGEEMLVTGLTVNALEAAGAVGKRSWLIYVVAVCLRIPFHLYYGWASLGVIIFTVVNIWVYRRWRLLWPIVLAHATYDFIEYLASVAPNAIGGLLILGLGFATLVMVIIVLCIELSDRGVRRRYAQYTAATQAAYAAQTAQSAYAAPPTPPQVPPVPQIPQVPRTDPESTG